MQDRTAQSRNSSPPRGRYRWQRGEEIGGRFVLEGRLAVGGMGEVYLAQMLLAGGARRRVVLKRIRPHLVTDESFVTMFLDEARLASQLAHSGVVSVVDVVHDGLELFLVLEYVPGWDLASILQRTAQSKVSIPMGAIVYVAQSLADTLAYVHDARNINGSPLNVVHRDVSPSNVLLAHDASVRLLDFGVAKAATQVTHTLVRTLKGKLAYMSPEQARGEPVDRRADLYALGLVVFEMATGKRAIVAKGEETELRAARSPVHRDPSSIRAEARPLDDIVRVLLQIDRDGRPPTAHHVVERLREIRVSGCSGHDTQAFVNTLMGSSARGIEGEKIKSLDEAFALVADLDPGAVHHAGVESDPSGSEYAATVAARSAGTTDDVNISRGRSKTALFVLACVLALGAVAWGVMSFRGSEPLTRSPSPVVPAVVDEGSRTAEPPPAPSRPPPAAPSASGDPSLVTDPPDSVNDASPGDRTPRATFGLLDVNTVPWSRVSIGRRTLAESTPAVGLRLPVGTHRIVLTNTRLGLRVERRVVIHPGRRTRLVVRLE